MRRIILLGTFIVLCSLTLWAQPKRNYREDKDYQPTVLVELFSSEGCSSCPFADAFMKEVIEIGDTTGSPVYVIDYHVVLWNRSGWVDPFSDSAYSFRQQDYLERKQLTAMYTPMTFINGSDKDYAGNDRRSVGMTIQQELSKPSKFYLRTGVAGVENEDSLLVQYQIWGVPDSMDLRVALVQREINNQVTAGENAGKILHHHNVVKGLWSKSNPNNEGMIKIPVSRQLNLDNFRLVIFLQQQRTWKVVATSQLTFKP